LGEHMVVFGGKYAGILGRYGGILGKDGVLVKI
jgi:hypothetical protein